LAEVSIKEAAQRLGVTEVTIRRRIRDGHLHAHQQPRPQGFTWVVTLPDQGEEPSSLSGQSSDGNDGIEDSRREDVLEDIIRRQDETIQHLRHELEARRREVQELHVLLQQAQALPTPKSARRWWKWWGRR
jgi:predicted ArsR family transcriptional regulator